MSQVIVYVSDMEKATHFYRDLLGLAQISQSEQWSEFNVGPAHLALHWSSLDDEVQGQPVVPAGNAELVFEVEDLDRACAEIREKGGAVEGPQMMEGLNVRVAFLRDPDGMAIELIEGRKESVSGPGARS
jgi:lactoylglutathione lyase